MRSSLQLLFFTLLLVSCNTYKFADYQSGRILKKNGLSFHTLDLEKYRLTYWDSANEKPPLVLIHGFGTSGKFQWYKQAKVLSEHYRLIIVNLFYFGSSPKTPMYTVTSQREAFHALLEKLNINSCYMCGSSYGGLVAAELVLHYPEKVKKLVLMDVPLKFFTEEDIRTVCMKYGISEQEELLVPSSPSKLKKLMEITYLKEPRLPMFILRSFYKYTYHTEKEHLHGIYQSLLKEKDIFADRDYQFKIPVLLVWGEKDELTPVHIGKELKEHIGSNARLELVPKSAHLPNLENKKAVDRLLIEFFEEGR